MNPEILFEDPHILAVNKPSGLVVHSDGKTEEPTLADWALRTYPALLGVGEPLVLIDGRVIDRPGIVHRLDRETSGVILLAKDQETFLWLKHEFQNRKITKIYNAFVYGPIKLEQGVIDRPIGKSRGDFRRWSAQPGARGELREALTEYTVLLGTPKYCFVEVRPKTGRTHQIRVHFKAIHHPVLCDTLYAPNNPRALGLQRLALHARALEVALPSGGSLKVEAPLPEDFKRALELLEKGV